MQTNAIICEYNPFHNGHKYQIEKIKSVSRNPVTAIMSGAFTQRGDVAVFDKFTRAKYAVHNGADLVIELPTVYACSSAESFARGGVQIAEGLGCTENLCFSVEEDNPELLLKAREFFNDEKFNFAVKDEMNSGQYYPRAVENAFKTLAPELAEIVTKPNNILALEYLKALKNTDIKPMIIKRKGTSHDSEEISGSFTSAGNIRNMILNGLKYESFIPEKTDFPCPADIKKLEKIILYRLRTMTKEEIKNLPDVTEGLENRIYNSIRSYNSVEEILSDVKTKRYTLSRLRRILIYALLGITKDALKREAPYLRVLAFNETGAKLLGEIKKSGTLPIITNVADGYKNLSSEAKKIFDIDLKASDIYSLATDEIRKCGEDFTRAVGIKK